MPRQQCTDGTAHGPHEWYWRNILRRECRGLRFEFCGREETHGPHWRNGGRGEACNGLGLAGRCEHGVQMLDECKQCEGLVVQDEFEPYLAEALKDPEVRAAYENARNEQ
jgi:hypothetical protein